PLLYLTPHPPLIKLYDYLDKLVNIPRQRRRQTFLKVHSLKCLESRSKSIKRPLESRQFFEVVSTDPPKAPQAPFLKD
ncbi:hypothetical protein WDU94_010217, partial [Cyamophila willieti]